MNGTTVWFEEYCEYFIAHLIYETMQGILSQLFVRSAQSSTDAINVWCRTIFITPFVATTAAG